MIKLATQLTLPVEVVTQTIGVVAKKRSGKSYFARRLTEQLHHARQQVVVVDPKGDWWGMLSSRDGKQAGLPIVIFGGERGHVPLEPSGGELVAKLVVEERVSALLDLSNFRKHEVATFMAPFLEALYRMKSPERYRTPVMVLIDEADAIAPQKPQPNEARMLGAASDLVRRGGQRGIGCTMITQRTAVLSKDVLTQVQILVALRTVSPQDLRAMNEWIDVHGSPRERKTLMESLPSLPVGDAWVWSPGWPTDGGIFQRIHTLPIETYDSGATPKPGERRVEPKNLAEVDLDAVRAQMADTLERVKQDDPRELRKRIAELERAAAAPAPRIDWTPFQDAAIEIESAHNRLQGALNAVRRLLSAPPPEPAGVRMIKVPPEKREAILDALAKVPPARIVIDTPSGPSKLAAGERKILTALAQHPNGCTRKQLALFTVYAVKAGGFGNLLSALRTSGLIEGRDTMRITEAGFGELGAFTPLPTGVDLRRLWMQKLSKAERLILDALCDAYPAALTRDELGKRTNYEPAGGGFGNALSRLRSLELIEGRTEMIASEELCT